MNPTARTPELPSPPPPPATPPGDVTGLLRAYGDGDRAAFDRAYPLVYDDLRRIARRQLGRRRGHGAAAERTLDATGLVHEVYLRMARQTPPSLNDRQHFMALSARAMRQVLIANVRRRGAAKRGGGERPATLDEGQVADRSHARWLLALDEALERLQRRDERMARVVEYRFFGGLSEEETARRLGVSLRTVQRDWTRARAWLRTEIAS